MGGGGGRDWRGGMVLKNSGGGPGLVVNPPWSTQGKGGAPRLPPRCAFMRGPAPGAGGGPRNGRNYRQGGTLLNKSVSFVNPGPKNRACGTSAPQRLEKGGSAQRRKGGNPPIYPNRATSSGLLAAVAALRFFSELGEGGPGR